MPKRFKKHPTKMSSEELAQHVFHPKVLKAAKEHIAKMNAPIKRRKSAK